MQAQFIIATFGDPRLPPRFWAKVRVLPNSCWQWTGARALNGYGHLGMGSRTVYAHRLAYDTLIGPIPDGLELDHLCRNRGCVNPSHIEPVTRAINLQRSPLVGRNGERKGEANGRAKLTQEQVQEIRALRGKLSGVDLAQRYGVGPTIISDIQRGKKWQHVP